MTCDIDLLNAVRRGQRPIENQCEFISPLDLELRQWLTRSAQQRLAPVQAQGECGNFEVLWGVVYLFAAPAMNWFKPLDALGGASGNSMLHSRANALYCQCDSIVYSLLVKC